MGFRLVPNSVTLNDLERRNRPNGCLISLNSVAFLADCVRMFEDRRILSAGASPGRKQWGGQKARVGLMASAEREPITGVWRQSPQRGPGAECE